MPLFGPASSATSVTSGNFNDTRVAERPDGSVVILWVDRSPGVNQYDVRGKVVAADGTVLVADFLVSTVATGGQDLVAVAARASDGAFLATWRNYIPGPPGQPATVTLQAQLFDAAGNRLGAEYTIVPGRVEKVEIAPLADGGFMVVWESTVPPGQSHQILAQRLDASGAEIGSELTLFVPPGPPNIPSTFFLGEVHQLPSGELVVAALQDFTNPSSPPSIGFVQTFDLAGNATDSPETLARDMPDLGFAADGGFFASYQISGPPLYVQRFDASAEKVGAPVTLVGAGNIGGTDRDIIALPDGGFLISWEGTSISGAGQSVFAQTFTAAGVRSGPVIELATNAGLLAITTEDDGSFQLTFAGSGALQTQRFEPQAYPPSGTFTGTAGGDNLIGGDGNDIISALGGNDRLYGGNGNDQLNGGTGADVTDGGMGDDFHYVDNLGDVVIELDGEGYDNLQSSIDWVLAENVYVEVLSTTLNSGTGRIDLTGNSRANVIVGNDGKNVIDGKSGADILVGLGGDDFMLVDAEDRVYENVGGGYDNVQARQSYALLAGQEIEVLSAAGPNFDGIILPINLTGNEFGQVLVGNSAANVLNGGGGADILQGLGGADTYIVDADDRVYEAANGEVDYVATSDSYALLAGQGIEILSTTDNAGTAAINLTGNELLQVLVGNAGNNIINGGGGSDIFDGLGGNDTYIVGAGDRVYEAVARGSDSVAAKVSYALLAGQEIELLSTNNNGGTASINLTGNEFGQVLVGNAGNNVLDGGNGSDLLQGLSGADMFQFTTALGAGNVDTILDFAVGTDRITLDNTVFNTLPDGALNPNAFFTGTAAHDADDRIMYDGATGQLFYDADGNGAGAQVLFATLTGAPIISASDILVI
jgi:Ca2+-binding RTX toxin-like protein